MKKFILTILLFTLTLSSFAQTTFYFKGAPEATPTNFLQNASAWSTDSTGVAGSAPNNFLNPNDTFVVQKGLSTITDKTNRIFLNAHWEVKGKIIVGNSKGGEVRLNIAEVNFKAGLLDIVDNVDSRAGILNQNRLVFNGSGNSYFNVTLGNLSPNSFVNYNCTTVASNQPVLLGNYAHLRIDGGTTVRGVSLSNFEIGVSKTFSVFGSNITFNISDQNIINYNGTISQTITPFNYKGLKISGSSTRTVTLPAGTIGVGSALTVTATNATYSIDNSNIVNYNSATWTQTIANLPYKTLQISSPNQTSFDDGGNSSTYNLENLNITSSNTIDTKWATINVSGAFTISGTPTFSINGLFNFNGSSAQTIPSLKGVNAYNHLTVSGAGVKSLQTGVNVNGIFSMQGLALSGANAPTYGLAATLEYKTATNLTSGVEWVSPFLATGGVIIDGISVATISLNASKIIGNNTNVGLTIKSTGSLITNSNSLTFHGDFVRATGSVFTADASPITITGSQNTTVNIAGFTTTGLISFTKSDYRNVVNILGRLPQSGIGSFNMLVNCNYTTGNDVENELNFKSGISSFHTTGDLTLTKGRLFLHRATANNELNNTSNQQINQCHNLIMNASTSYLSYCNLQMNQGLSSIFKLTGNFTKTGGRLEGSGATSLNGNFQFSGPNGTNHDVITDNDDLGKLYQTTFQVMSGNTVTFKSDFNINRTYSGWESFVVETGGTLDFGQLTTSPFTAYKILGGITFEAKAGSTLIIRHPEGLYSGRDFNAPRFEAQSNPLGNLGVVQTLQPFTSQIQTTPGVFLPVDGFGNPSTTAFKRRFFSSGANYIFAGTGNQKTGIFQTSINNGDVDLHTVNNLTVTKSLSAEVVTGLQDFAVTNICNIAKGIFQIGESTPTNVSQTLTLNGTLTGINATDCLRGNTVSDLAIGNSGTGGNGALGSNLFFDQSVAGKSSGANADGSGGDLTPGVTNNLRNFTLNRTGQSITLANEMQVNNTLTPTAGTLVSGGKLVMLSTDATTSSILALGGTASITGDVVVQSFFKGGTVEANRGFRMIASPTGNTATFFPQIKERFIVTCVQGPPVGCDFRPVKSPNAQTLTKYLEPGIPGANSFENINHTSTMEVGRGYYFFFRGSRAILNATTPGKINEPFAAPEDWTAAYTGSINSGDKLVPVTKTVNGDSFDGLNLVGNPYPAVLNFTSFRSDASNTGIIDNYFMIMKRDRSGFFSYSDNIPNGSLTLVESAGAAGGTAKYPFIQPGQAFFVRKKDLSNANITFKESHKATAGNSKEALRTLSIKDEQLLNVKTTNPTVRQLIRFSIESKEITDDATIVLENGNSANYGGNDAPYMANNTIYTYSLTADDKPAAINFMPAVADVKEIKLYVEATKSDANLKLNFTELVGAGKNEVWLTDNYTQTKTLISESNRIYNFSIDKSIKATSGKDRFVLFFVPKIVYEINLIDFNAVTNNVGVQLNWETQTEDNATKFELQRSIDGLIFETINTQISKALLGNSTQSLLYSFVDKNAQTGKIYYRLKMFVKNETSTISEIKTVNFGLSENNTLIVYPSVVKDELNMRWKGQNNDKFNLAIYDVSGKMVLSYSNLKGQSYTTNVAHLNTGVYILKIKDQVTNKLTAVRKFIKN